ncbi:hypothetical protein Mp_4g13660 [Marchantia polymorpha subsp. ruderalis]|uniref:Uncharacterized protein n=2 Tax=Marchantia polymorpha TaxID=3197 RepID=A0AAF6B9L0_MARPO|nr:hypothetical protein MARPO_0273s0001 [Marchantia polymorpha]BBN08694.1 hypothetical protein Mp_4g13660 [Marchantia polymorpha subsp. ruderalis]|eukprot:PTQ26908.1 hypothetical protein MARPO_0273s0001 [Marchantia polymorpha]
MDGPNDEAAARRFIYQWARGYPTVFKFYATGGSDAFFVFDEERKELDVVKYWAELNLIFFLPQPPFHSRNPLQNFVYAPNPIDPWCAIIPSPRGSAGHGWIRQQEFKAQEQRREEEDMREAPTQALGQFG